MFSQFIAGLIPQHIEALIQHAREEGTRCALEQIAEEESRRNAVKTALLDDADSTLYGPEWL